MAVRPDVKTLRASCLTVLTRGNYTADEVAERLGESVLSIRPRITELKRMGRIEDTGLRRTNESGHRAAVMRTRVPF